jgi:hypothetical protein
LVSPRPQTAPGSQKDCARPLHPPRRGAPHAPNGRRRRRPLGRFVRRVVLVQRSGKRKLQRHGLGLYLLHSAEKSVRVWFSTAFAISAATARRRTCQSLKRGAEDRGAV